MERSNIDLSEVQYYTSNGFALKRIDGTSGDIEVDELGVLQFDSGSGYDMVTVSRNTPGTCLYQRGSHRVGIAFEAGKYIFYESDSSEVAYGNRYLLRRDQDAFGQRLATWDSYKDYETHFTEGEVWLQVKKRKLAKLLRSSRVLKGQRVYGANAPKKEKRSRGGFWDRFNVNNQKRNSGGKQLPKF